MESRATVSLNDFTHYSIAAIRDDFREQPPHTLDVSIGLEVSIPCKPPRGKPDPKVRWKKDSELVKYSDRIVLDESGSLRIKETLKEDSGVYVCVAFNTAGDKESMPCQLSVKGIVSLDGMIVVALDSAYLAPCIKFVSLSCSTPFALHGLFKSILPLVFQDYVSSNLISFVCYLWINDLLEVFCLSIIRFVRKTKREAEFMRKNNFNHFNK